MIKIVVLCQIMFFVSLVCWTSSCVSKRDVVAEKNRPAIIRFGDNGVPNLVKGDNLSATLDGDEAFQRLRAKKRYTQMALYYLDRQKSLFRLTSARQEFVAESVISDVRGQTHVRLSQVYNGIPVWGRTLGVHLNGDDQIYYVHGSYQPISSGLSTKAVLAEDVASQIAIQSKQNSDKWRVDDVKMCIYAPSNEVQQLSYMVNLVRNALHREYCFVDAANGHVLHCVSKTTHPVGLLNKSY